MTDKDFVEIHITRVIPAPKWRVIRMLTRLEEFPSYIPCVKQVVIIQKGYSRMLTKWRVLIDSVPIGWTEEDVLALKESRITFKTVDGDLQAFSGEWQFNSVEGGTEVSVHACLGVAIPIIRDFARVYLKKLLTRNFEAILEAVELRLISTRYASYKQGNKDKIAGFGIIGHAYNLNHLIRCMKKLNPGFNIPSQEFLGPLFNLTPSLKLHDIREFKSPAGAVTNGCFIAATFIPDMLEQNVAAIYAKVVRACKVAEKYGVGIVTLGGFTSIVGERIGQEISRETDVPVTTGNTFTAAMALDGIFKAAGLLGQDISLAKAAIVGGTGDIGSACARVLAGKVKQLTITGRTKANLKSLGAELSRQRKAKITATTDNLSAIKDADIVIAAASASASILNIDWFKPGAIICDIGYPKNVSYAPTKRKDILIFSGGLTKSPMPISFPIDTGLPTEDTLYGCFAEAIILALEKRFENFSFGRGNISQEKINEIRELGKKHGFTVSDFYWGDKIIDQSLINNIKEAVGV